MSDDVEKFNYLFFCFWVGVLFCRLLWSGFDELVSVMEGDLAAQWTIFMSSVNHLSWGRLVLSSQRSKGM